MCAEYYKIFNNKELQKKFPEIFIFIFLLLIHDSKFIGKRKINKDIKFIYTQGKSQRNFITHINEVEFV